MADCCCCGGPRIFSCCPPGHRDAFCHCISDDCERKCSKSKFAKELKEKELKDRSDKKASRYIKLQLKISEETQKKLILILQQERVKGRKISEEYFRTNDLFEELVGNYELE
jgi:epoxyqueuosine reductase QueG